MGAAEPKQRGPKPLGAEEVPKSKRTLRRPPPKAAGALFENALAPLDAVAGALIPKPKAGNPNSPPPNEEAEEPNAGALGAPKVGAPNE